MRWAKLTLLAVGTALALAAFQAPATASTAHAAPGSLLLTGPGSGQQQEASLAVSIASLPRGVRARVVVTGPRRFLRYVPRSMKLRKLEPGRYVVRAFPVRVGSGRLYPVTAAAGVRLQPGENGTVQVSYADDVPDTTKVAAAGSVTGLSGSPGGPATLTLASLPGGLAAGDILAVGVTPATPDGFLGKVTAVSSAGTGFLVSTVPATLLQAMPSGEIDPRWQEPPQDQPVDSSGVSCGAGASLSVTGSLGLTPGGDFTARWVNGVVTKVSFDATATLTQQLQAAVTGAANCTIDNQPLLAEPIRFPPIAVDIGIPFVLVPELQFKLSADASTSASLTAGITMSESGTAGLSYANGQLTPIAQIGSPVYTPKAPTPDLAASLSASVGPSVGLLIYGQAGPEVNIGGSLALDVTPLSSPAWTLTGALQAGAGLAIPALDFDESNPDIISLPALLAASPPVIQTATLPAGTAGTPYSQALTASRGTPPYTWSISSGTLPPGLSLDPATGAITGNPATPGTYGFTAEVADSSRTVLTPDGQSATAAESITIGASGGAWGTAIQVPGTGALNSGLAELSSVSCPSAGNCAAGGYYADASGHLQAFVVDEVNGTWGTAIEVPGIASLNNGGSGIGSVSCSSAGNCGAGGVYTDAAGHFQAFVVDEVNGTWGTAIEVPGTASLNVGGYALTGSVSCSSPGNCSAGGVYSDQPGRFQAFVAGEVNGTWGTATGIPGFGSLNFALSQLTSVSCGSAGNCAAGGYYTDSSVHQQAFVVDEANGTWGAAVEVPGTATLNAGGNAQLTSASCTSAGNCEAGGYYTDSSIREQAFVVDEANGTWGAAVEVPGTATLNAGGNAQLTSVSCGSAGSCAAGGYYTDGSGHQQAFVVDEASGTWGTAVEVPGTATLNAGGNTEVFSVSCASAGNCAAGGYYTDGSGAQQAFVVDEVNGTWGTAVEVPGTGSLNAGANGRITSLSCPTAASCGAGGYYTDGTGRQQVFVVSQG